MPWEVHATNLLEKQWTGETSVGLQRASKGFKCKLLLRGGLREMVGGNSSGNVTNVLKKVPAVVLWFGRRMQYTHDRLLPLRNIWKPLRNRVVISLR